MDREAASKELAKDLDKRHVKPPPQGKFGEYVQGWHVIAEANRIFGFFDWAYSVERLEVVSAEPNQGKNDDQWEICYMAIVKVGVDGSAVRMDVGYGSGFAKSQGDAHESAGKEAVTDALKRALRTFGNPLGNALYDKSKEHVSDNPNASEEFEAAIAAHTVEINSLSTEAEVTAKWQSINLVSSAQARDPRIIEACKDRKISIMERPE